MVYQWLHPAGSSEHREVEKCMSRLLMLTLCSCRLLNDTNTPDHQAGFTSHTNSNKAITQFNYNVINHVLFIVLYLKHIESNYFTSKLIGFAIIGTKIFIPHNIK